MSSEADHVSPVRSIALRLGLWQAGLFAAAAAGTFLTAYHFLANSLEARERGRRHAHGVHPGQHHRRKPQPWHADGDVRHERAAEQEIDP